MENLAIFGGIMIMIWGLLMLLVIGIGVTFYVFRSLGMYHIAKRRGIHNPWLAWLPVGQSWILGSVSDHYQYIARGKTRNYRKVLMWLEVGLYVISLVMSIISVVTSMGAVVGAAMEMEELAILGSMGLAGFSIIMSLVVVAASVAYSVFAYICYYDVFRSCKPENATLFLILSIFVSAAMPFLIFACRKSDEGMPPKIRNTVNS